MRIALAQTKPKVRSCESNIADHTRFTKIAIEDGCNCIVFPELSLLGYEPKLARTSAIRSDAPELARLQELSDDSGCTIILGAPLQGTQLPNIASITLAPSAQPTIYCKRILHPDELPYFAAGRAKDSWVMESPKTAIVICFELSDDPLIESACQAGAELLIASVAKHSKGMTAAHLRLSGIASRFQVPTLIVNSVGLQDGMDCSGGSAAWNRGGRLLTQLEDEEEGLLIVDVVAGELTTAKTRYLYAD
ncbi:MAG: carbon-nitrogen hydrolase family protein [Pirellulaceae bacterium]